MSLSTFQKHCTFALIFRIILVAYANFHDKYFKVPYTDIDYKVYTDAARFLTQNESPYLRHTYRYSPMLAFLLTPNIFLHPDFGKIFFSIIDIIVAILIRNLVIKRQCSSKVAEICAYSWLYNPLTIVISTRGNADSLAVLLVLWTLYYLLNDKPFTSGIVHGLSVHFRLYPIAFSLVMFLAVRDHDKKYWNLSKNQIKLVIGCIFSLTILTGISYYFYGFQFLYESCIYHLIRKDARHNFSVYFYMLYLSIGQTTSIFEKIFRLLPLVSLLIGLSFRYSNKQDLPFAMLTQAMVMVAYNSVITSQYFFWYLSLLPVCLPYIQMSIIRIFLLICAWVFSQGFWLYHAYYLEFLGLNTFFSIWIDSLIFFFVNVKILVDVIDNYKSVPTKIMKSLKHE